MKSKLILILLCLATLSGCAAQTKKAHSIKYSSSPIETSSPVETSLPDTEVKRPAYDRMEPTYDQTYYIVNKATKKYHKPSCSYLPSEANAIKIQKSELWQYSDYSRCGHCKPLIPSPSGV